MEGASRLFHNFQRVFNGGHRKSGVEECVFMKQAMLWLHEGREEL